MKDIVIIDHFSHTPFEDDSNRLYYLAKVLTKYDKNIAVEIITTDFNHTEKKVARTSMQQTQEKLVITSIHEPPYKKNICLNRLLSHHIAGKNLKKYLKNRKKPDVIYCAVPSLSMAAQSAKFAKKNKIKFIIDIQDLWPEAFRMAINIPIFSAIVFKPMEFLANSIYKQADKIIAVSETYYRRALKVNKKCKDPLSVYIGIDLEEIKKQQTKNSAAHQRKITLIYSGTLGHSYDLKSTIDALSVLGEKAPKFLIAGDGPLKNEYLNYAQQKKIDFCYLGYLPYNKMINALFNSDIAINPLIKQAPQSITNKHGDYAAAGLPVINSQPGKEYRELIEKYDMGINCECENIDEIARAIKELTVNTKKRNRQSINASKCAKEKFDRNTTYIEIISKILNP